MWEIQNLYKKLNKLPEPVKSYATSLKAAEINSELFNMSQVDSDKWSTLTILIAGIIVKEIEFFDLEKKISQVLGWDEERSLKLAIEIVGSRLLVCDDWLEGAAEKYLTQQQTDPSRFASLVAEQQLAIEKEEEFFAEQLREPEDTSDWEGNDFSDVLNEDDNLEEDELMEEEDIIADDELENKRKEIVSILKNNFLSILKSEDEEELADFNYFLAYIWMKDGDFSQEVTQNLLANKEKISGSSLMVDSKEQAATISSLLKQFIKKYGLVANDLNIAEFLSSTVTKNLADQEKIIALRILKFYNNLNKIDNYLQNDLDNVPDNFEIFPAKAVARSNSGAKSKIKPSSDWDKLEPASLKKVDKKIIADEREADRIRQATDILEPKAANLAQELEIMLQDYPAGSLERRTIAQEIKRLKTSEKNNE
ncbi:MAG: hypothetical protein PHX76_03010 [Patescibacteria group bacterium]|nr:hypothetical protein [Patescibacteria group bacterium]MDD4444059.1 hypothetical protein [Patescibacteria group bacterium]